MTPVASTERVGVDTDLIERAILFMAPLLVFWITLRPLTDLSNDAVLQPRETGDLFSQVLFVSLFALAIAKLVAMGGRRALPLAHPAYLSIIVWLTLSSLLSVDLSLSLRRLVLSILVMGIVGVALLLPRDVRQFSTWIGATALTVVALCYLAVILVPHLAVHQSNAVVEANLSGNWRGIYDHKSRAGPMMVIFLFIGLFLLRERRYALGGSLSALAAVFLLFTGAKQPTLLVPFILVLSWIAGRVGSRTSLVMVLLIPLALYNLFTVGSAVLPGIAAVDAKFLSDPTFTDRTGIWRFAIENVLQHPFTGWGFHAFWNTGRTLFNDVAGPDSYAVQASHSHNSYLDLALTTGFPGLLLALWALVLLPVLDYWRARQCPENARLATLFFQIWAFCVFAGAMETLFFQRDDSIWVSFLLAILGLRFLSERRLAP